MKRAATVAVFAFAVATGALVLLRVRAGASSLTMPASSLAMPAVTLPRLGAVPDFALTDENARPFSPRALAGRPFVADFVFTSCSEVCPRMTEEMARLQTWLVNRALPVSLVSITVDPERDTPARLADYARRFHARPGWHFLTGETKSVQDAVVDGFKQTMSREKDPAAADGITILHGTRFVLVDGEREIRGFYDPGDGNDMAKLRADVGRLVEHGGR